MLLTLLTMIRVLTLHTLHTLLTLLTLPTLLCGFMGFRVKQVGLGEWSAMTTRAHAVLQSTYTLKLRCEANFTLSAKYQTSLNRIAPWWNEFN